MQGKESQVFRNIFLFIKGLEYIYIFRAIAKTLKPNGRPYLTTRGASDDRIAFNNPLARPISRFKSDLPSLAGMIFSIVLLINAGGKRNMLAYDTRSNKNPLS
jgi:hypothetical protein